MCYVKDGKFFYAHQLLYHISIFLSPSGSFEETPTNLYYWMIKQNGDPLMWKVTPFFIIFIVLLIYIRVTQWLNQKANTLLQFSLG